MTGFSERYPALRGLFQHLLLVLLLSVIPVLVVVATAERELGKEAAAKSRQETEAFAAANEPVSQGIFARGAFRLFFQELHERTVNQPQPLREMAAVIDDLKKRWPGRFEAAFFDARHRLVASCSDLPEFHDGLASFGQDIADYNEWGSPGLQTHRAHYQRFLGPFVDFQEKKGSVLKGNDMSQYSGFSRTRGLILFPGIVSGKPWFMVWITPPADVSGFLFRFLVAEQFPLPGWADVVDLDDPPETWGKRLGEASRHLIRAMTLMGDRSGNVISSDGFLWTQVTASPRVRLVIATPDRARAWLQDSRRTLHGRAVFACLLLLAGSLIVRGRMHAMSLRMKLLLLFAYTTGIPLGFLFLCAGDLFAEKRQTMERAIFRDQESAVKVFSRGFTEYLGRLESKTLEARGPALSLDDEIARGEARTALERISRSLHPEVAELYDEKGKSLLQLSSGLVDYFQKLRPLFGVLIARICARINGKPLSSDFEVKEQFLRATLETMGIDIDEMSSSFVESPDAIISWGMSGKPISLMHLQFRDRSGRLRFIAVIGWSDRYHVDFVRRRLSSYQRNLRSITLATLPKGEGAISPLDFPLAEEAIQCSADLSLQSAPVQRKIEKNGKSWLMTGSLMQDVRHFCFACADDSPIRQAIRATAWRLALAGIFLMCLGIGVGLLISGHLLSPVEELARGVESTKNRDFSVRVQVGAQDEFGRLAQVFNHMMESLGELEVARIVQDTFFPREPLAGNGWEVCGSSIPASRVGGDYFDYFPLPDGRWLILIGDVTGHGVPAALVVAMAKALACHPGNPDKPSQILEIMNSCMLAALKRKRLMTCFLCIFDPGTGELTASNAGHNYPLLVGPAGIRKLAFSVPPLGVKAPRPFEDHAFVVSEEEFLIFFTDGIIEARDRQNELIGNSRFEGGLRRLHGSTARETEQAIWNWFNEIRAPGAQEDDTTLVVLQRSGDSRAKPIPSAMVPNSASTRAIS